MKFIYRIVLLSLLFCPILAWGMEETEEDLYLVVGSTRKFGYVNPFMKQVNGNEVDYTHRNTFNGKATTLDISPSDLPKLPHIQADARTYKPSSKATIQAVFMEIFPSIELSTTVEISKPDSKQDKQEEFNKLMLMPHAIKNLAQYMKEGATLDIEHVPFVSQFEMSSYASLAQPIREFNPFHCILSPFFMENIDARNYSGVPAKVNYWREILDKKASFLAWDDTAAGGIIHEAINDHPFILQAIQNIEDLLPKNTKVQQRLNIEAALYKSDSQDFYSSRFIGSLSELIALEFTMLKQKGLIQAFLEKNGFKGVKLERKTNPYNGRKNAWMISAIRNDKPIPKEDE